MTIYAAKIERLRVRQESSFGVDMTGLLPNSGWLDVPFREGTLKITPGNRLESPMHAQQRVDGHPEEKDIPATTVVEFECNLETFTSKATNAVSATQSWLGYFLKTWMGGMNLMTGTTVAAGSPTEVIFPATVYTTLLPGAAIGVARASDGVLEVREIQKLNVSNETVLKHNLSEAPTVGATVLGSATYYCNPLTTGAEFESLQFVLDGYTPDDKWVCIGGGVTGCEITLENGQIAKLKFTVTFAVHYPADGVAVAADLVGDTLGSATYLDTNTLVVADSEFCTAEPGTPDSVERQAVSSMSFEPAITYAMVRTPGGTNTVLQFVRTHVSPVLVIKFTEPYEDRRWFDLRDSHDPVAQWYQIGSAPTEGAVVFSAPNCQVKDVQRVDVDGVQSQEVTLVARHDTDTEYDAADEGIATSAFRIHMI